MFFRSNINHWRYSCIYWVWLRHSGIHPTLGCSPPPIGVWNWRTRLVFFHVLICESPWSCGLSPDLETCATALWIMWSLSHDRLSFNALKIFVWFKLLVPWVKDSQADNRPFRYHQNQTLICWYAASRTVCCRVSVLCFIEYDGACVYMEKG